MHILNPHCWAQRQLLLCLTSLSLLNHNTALFNIIAHYCIPCAVVDRYCVWCRVKSVCRDFSFISFDLGAWRGQSDQIDVRWQAWKMRGETTVLELLCGGIVPSLWNHWADSQHRFHFLLLRLDRKVCDGRRTCLLILVTSLNKQSKCPTTLLFSVLPK